MNSDLTRSHPGPLICAILWVRVSVSLAQRERWATARRSSWGTRHQCHLMQLFMLAVINIPCLLFGQCEASVNGTVVDGNGNPIPGAQVSFIEDKVYEYQQLPRAFYLTDTTGRFSAAVSISSPGTFWVMARKTDDGYPDNRILFYLDREPPKVPLNCDVPQSGIVVQLGPKVAYIQRLTILDAQTAKPVENATITLRRVSRAVDWTRLDALSL